MDFSSDDDEYYPHSDPVPPKKEEVQCLCKQCRESALGKYNVCHPREYYTRRETIEKQILADYTERNGHLAEGDPIRHLCGNGAMDARRYLILQYKGFCVHVANPSKPMPYMTTDGGIGYAFGRPLRPGEIRNSDSFRNSFKTADGMTIPDYRRLIDDYFLHHEMFDSQCAAFPHHHVLVMASMSSTCAMIERVLPIPRCFSFRSHMYFEGAKQRAQNPFEITRFTPMSGLQKNMILAHSGIAGIVISRLFSPPTDHFQDGKQLMQLLHGVVHRVHSRAECEIFADNRYGKSCLNEEVAATEADDSLTLEMATDELRVLYTGHIQHIMRMVRQLKRGYLNADDIRHAIPEFQRMHQLWAYCLQEVIAQYEDEIQYEDGHHIRKMVGVARMVGEFPLLYLSEMTTIYSKTSATLAKNTIAKLIQMEGAAYTNMRVGWCRAGLLAFAAVEPRMVDQFLAPRLEIVAWDGNDRYQAIENHIPSRCPIFGNLRAKYQVHLPRTGDCEWEICRKKGGMVRSFISYSQSCNLH